MAWKIFLLVTVIVYCGLALLLSWRGESVPFIVVVAMTIRAISDAMRDIASRLRPPNGETV